MANVRSRLTDWVLRLLFVMVLLVGLAMFFIHLVSGTGDAQKHGLEQALSNSTGGSAKIGKLTEFNLLPQFTVGVEDISVEGKEKELLGTVKRARLAFGFADVMLKRPAVEALHVENMSLQTITGVTGGLIIDTADITDEKGAKLEVKGKIGHQGLSVSLDLARLRDLPRPSYGLRERNPVVVNMGDVQIKGDFVPNNGKGQDIQQANVTIGNHACGTGNIHLTQLSQETIQLLLKPVKTDTDRTALCQKLFTSSTRAQ